MNNVISAIVAVVACLIVIGGAVVGIHVVLGQWAILAWVGGGLLALFAIAQRINA
jgi:hypothetical protein